MVKSHAHYMDHKHYTDIMHGHDITDPGHSHSTSMNIFDNSGNINRDQCMPGIYGSGIGVNSSNSSRSYTGISVNSIGENERFRLSTESRYIGNEGVNRQYTDSNDANAIENRPQNYTNIIWKRIA